MHAYLYLCTEKQIDGDVFVGSAVFYEKVLFFFVAENE